MTRRSLILDTTVRVVFDGVLVLSVYLLFAGHNQPGGGFVGGLVAGAGVSLRYIAGGIDDVRSLSPVPPWSIQGTGLALASGTALWPLLFGGAPLDQTAVDWHVPVVGAVHFTTAAVFDTGVYLIVLGLALMMFEGLGNDTDSEAATDATPPARPETAT